MRGVVKFFNYKRLFGFINGEDTKDYFFHNFDVIYEYNPDRKFQKLVNGDLVEFEIEVGPEKMQAKKVKIIKEEPTKS